MSESKIQHTPGPWKGKRVSLPLTSSIYHEVHCGEKTPIVNWAGFDDSTRTKKQHLANAELLGLAPTAPHSCDVPDCPGARNQRCLEDFDALLGFLEHSIKYANQPFNESKLTKTQARAILTKHRPAWEEAQ